MAIYAGTPTVPPLGGYARPNNPGGKTISRRQRQPHPNPTARKLQLAMRTAAAWWQSLSPERQQVWFTATRGMFIRRDGERVAMPSYRGYISHTMSPLFCQFPAWLSSYRVPMWDLPLYHSFRWHQPTQAVTFTFHDSFERTGSSTSGVSVYQVHPDYLNSPDLIHHTKHIGAITPWGNGEEHPTLTAPLAWPVDHPTRIHCLIRNWEYCLLASTVDTWSGTWNAERPDYPEYCEGGAELTVTGLLIPCPNGWFWPRQDRFGEPCWSNPKDAPFDSGCWIYKPGAKYQIWLSQSWPAYDALWESFYGPVAGYYNPVTSCCGRACVSFFPFPP